jgi:DNA-binding winged helix-turn-helix (wHTH) protein
VLDRVGDASARRTAFAAGADDVVHVPCETGELATKILALAGRVRPHDTTGPVYRLRGLVVDVAAHSVRLNGRPLVLTAQQFAILRALFEARGVALERSRLLSRIEALDDEPPSERAVDLHVTRLRRRLGDSAGAPRFIESVYGVGYRLASDAAPPAQLGDRAEDVLVALPDALLVIDSQLQVRFANDAATRLLVRSRRELVGRSCSEVLECADCMGARLDGPRCFARALRNGTTTLRDVSAEVRAGDEHIAVTLTYGRVQADGLITLEIRPRTVAAPGGSPAD